MKKTKFFTLDSGSEENGWWSVYCIIRTNGSFRYRGSFRIRTKEEDKKSNTKRKEYQHKYYIQHKKMREKRRRENYAFFRSREKKNLKKFRATEKGRISQHKAVCKRRGMGSNVIAEFKENKIMVRTHFHHINNFDMIEIPEWLHCKCSNPDRNKHRDLVKSLLQSFLMEEYYNIIDKEKFEEYKNE